MPVDYVRASDSASAGLLHGHPGVRRRARRDRPVRHRGRAGSCGGRRTSTTTATCTRSCGITGTERCCAERHVTENLENEWTDETEHREPLRAFIAGQLAADSPGPTRREEADPAEPTTKQTRFVTSATSRKRRGERLDPVHYDYFAGGAQDEVTVRANEAAFGRLGAGPPRAAWHGEPTLEVSLLGCRASAAGPAGADRVPPAGAPRGRARHGAGGCRDGHDHDRSMASTVAIEESLRPLHDRGEPGLWFQLYIQPDLGFTEALVRRAEAAGCAALVVTVGLARPRPPRAGPRNGFHDLPAGLRCENLRECAAGAGQRATGRHCRRRSPGATSTGCDRPATCRSCSRASFTPRTRSSRSTAASMRSSSPTTAAASSTRVPATIDLLPRDRRGRRRDRFPCCSTAGSGAGPTSSRRWRSARTRSRSGGRCCGGSRRTASAACVSVLEMLRDELDARAHPVRLRSPATRPEVIWRPVTGGPDRSERAVLSLRTGCRRRVVALRMRVFTRVNGDEGIPMPGDAGRRRRTSRRSTPTRRRTAAAGARRCRTCSGTGSPRGRRSTRSTSRRASATTRSPAPPGASSPCPRRSRGADRTLRSSASSTSSARGDLRLVRLARPDDAGLGRVLLRARLRRAVPAAGARPDRGNANDVVTALKCCGLRHMDRRDRLTRFLIDRLAAGPPVQPLPDGAVDPGAGAVPAGHVLQHRGRADVRGDGAPADGPRPAPGRAAASRGRTGGPRYLDQVIDETLRLYPLFGIAHRITTAEIAVGERHALPAGSVLCFNYPAFHAHRLSAIPRTSTLTAGSTWTGERRTTSRSGSRPTGRARHAESRRSTMQVVAREVLRRFALYSSASHTRSLPNRGPCLLRTRNSRVRHRRRPRLLAFMRVRDRWEDLWRSVVQLVLGTYMVVDARRQRLAQRYFEPDVRVGGRSSAGADEHRGGTTA